MTEDTQKGLSNAAYEHLVMAVRGVLAESERAGRDADSSKALGYWRVGDVLVAAGVVGRDHYGGSVIRRVAEDLEIDPRTLWRSMVFRRLYDKKRLDRSSGVLVWSHYRQLIEISDEAERLYYEEKAMAAAWSRDRLKAAIVGREYEREVNKDTTAGVLKRPTNAEYVFKARLVNVVDGDTLVLDIRCGFKMVREQERIRLAGLNSPEITTKKGKESHLFVRGQLEKAVGLVVKTEKTDDFGRYVGHVFYSFKDDKLGAVYEHGVYLNEELLRKGFAERM